MPTDLSMYFTSTTKETDMLLKNKYLTSIKDTESGIRINADVYSILVAFNVSCPARAHAIKKLLCAGTRGHKSEKDDLCEAIQAIERAIQLLPDEEVF